MVESTIVNRRYSYIHDDSKCLSQALDLHIIELQNTNRKRFILFILSLVILSNASFVFLFKDVSISVVFSIFVLSGIVMKSIFWNSVVKECVMVMPAFGVQLETHYMSGKINRCFVPIGNILKPVLLECVTPVSCYWRLSLLLREEAELMLVCKELRPPVKMLLPIWKALCSAVVARKTQMHVQQMASGEVEAKELRPPVKMLLPIWKALCSACGSEENPNAGTADG